MQSLPFVVFAFCMCALTGILSATTYDVGPGYAYLTIGSVPKPAAGVS
jgi:hypothetical protein